MNKIICISTVVLVVCWSVCFFILYGSEAIIQVIAIGIVTYGGIRAFSNINGTKKVLHKQKKILQMSD
ncbi:hypothetical protein [Rhizosphaericola mali]|uniref:Uncharacterized protein n=1 Tax=Rhizosphaericola mali TaxID=2545455 RepID=A0A5P2FWY1_9BACT|nr:hypothetical protein [Rhizosphaericola mali]QES88026.1 hypothetical protein E0W69_004890 [Rhizosphaericola mali]